EDPSHYAASIDWGDGSSSAGTISSSGGLFTVQGDHRYADEGSYPITVSVAHDAAAMAIAGSAANVADAALCSAGQNVSAVADTAGGPLVVATFTDLGGPEAPGEYDAVISWGDNSGPVSGTVTYDSVNQVFTVSGTHTYAVEGSYAVGVLIT